ncbi:MAG: histidinol-phosphate transaminase [Bdellovibrionales bacterium]
MDLKISKEILDLVPYKPGQSEKDVKAQYNRDFFVKLASNESPLPPSRRVRDALLKAADEAFLYPDPSCRNLREVASKYFDTPAENILVGNGSNELIDLLIRLVCEPGESVMTSVGAFIAYKICARASRANVIEIPLRADYTIDLSAFSKKLEELEVLPKIIFIPNPNNPIGAYIPKAEVDEFLAKWGGRKDLLIVFDEAYTEFVDVKDFPQTLDLLKHENVLVLKTMSKVFGLASLRVGLLLGSPEVLGLLHRIRNPFNVNSFAQAAAAAALQDQEAIEKIQELVISGRNDFAKFLDELNVKYVPSQANFIFFDTEKPALEVHDALLKEGVIVRPLIGYGFKTQLRITIGDKEQMDFAKSAFRKVFG